MKNKSAFTLVELLVTMVIMVILMSISLFALNSARVAARDSRRVADLEVIRSGLEAYRSDCNVYPASISAGSSLSCGSITETTKVPTDPQSSRAYAYSSATPFSSYFLCAALEQVPSPAGDISGCGSCGSAVCNYKTISP